MCRVPNRLGPHSDDEDNTNVKQRDGAAKHGPVEGKLLAELPAFSV